MGGGATAKGGNKAEVVFQGEDVCGTQRQTSQELSGSLNFD